MKVKSTVKSPAPDIVAGIATAGICVMAGPLGLLAFPFLRALGRKGLAEEMDEICERDHHRVARKWHTNRKTGERTLEVSTTTGSGGLLFDLPMTRVHTFTLDEGEEPPISVRPQTESWRGSLVDRLVSADGPVSNDVSPGLQVDAILKRSRRTAVHSLPVSSPIEVDPITGLIRTTRTNSLLQTHRLLSDIDNND